MLCLPGDLREPSPATLARRPARVPIPPRVDMAMGFGASPVHILAVEVAVGQVHSNRWYPP